MSRIALETKEPSFCAANLLGSNLSGIFPLKAGYSTVPNLVKGRGRQS